MKKATIFLCAMLSLWGWQGVAQEQNTTCANAIEVSPDTSVTTAVEAGGSTYWYYFLGEAGKAYEISDCNGASFDTKLSYGSSCTNFTTQDDGS
ncbi:MAG: hypothetical protein LBF67_06765, partial [Prevotellaceae bacterium]|nr:hypothetical protein [Prevotellaceae bacterium]